MTAYAKSTRRQGPTVEQVKEAMLYLQQAQAFLVKACKIINARM